MRTTQTVKQRRQESENMFLFNFIPGCERQRSYFRGNVYAASYAVIQNRSELRKTPIDLFIRNNIFILPSYKIPFLCSLWRNGSLKSTVCEILLCALWKWIIYDWPETICGPPETAGNHISLLGSLFFHNLFLSSVSSLPQALLLFFHLSVCLSASLSVYPSIYKLVFLLNTAKEKASKASVCVCLFVYVCCRVLELGGVLMGSGWGWVRVCACISVGVRGVCELFNL